ncbi:MAG TPA: ankyrin repeat domain-containing protein [Gammaproteobacteria bacterium]|nr:ankyrin repeat domain-containing protein [Gammaproteobacteria bacterium]
MNSPGARGNGSGPSASGLVAAGLAAPSADGVPALHSAVRRNDLASARRLLAAGADPNLATRYGVTPLDLAAANGNEALIRLLVGAGADANARDAQGETMLMAAVGSGDLGAVRALLELGADVDARDPHYGQTALMFAARAGLADIVKALIGAGADVDAPTRVGAEPAWILPNSRPGFSFGIGIVRGGWPADRGMRPFRQGGMTPLLYAARDGHAAAAKVLLDAGASIELAEANRITPLIMAITNDRMDVATLLVERGANLDAQDWYGRSPLWSAVEVRNLYLDNATFQNHIDREPVLALIRLLLERGADPNVRTKESPPVREHLLPITWSLEWVDFTGQTPFITAALAGDVTVMHLLLEHGADPHITTYGGTTALMAAAGVDWVVSQTYTEGPTALLEAVKLCVDLGIDVNAVNSMGLTAVDGAANRGSDDIVEYLVSRGARLDVADKEGRTPLDWARGVFLATHPAEPKPSTIALIERLMKR